jgi:hypothetical protein
MQREMNSSCDSSDRGFGKGMAQSYSMGAIVSIDGLTASFRHTYEQLIYF